MHPRQFAFYGGLVMLALGILALLLPGPIAGLPELSFDANYGWFLGEFPMNLMNKTALIILGIAGLLASRARFTSLPASILFSRIVFYSLGALAILGLFHQTNTLHGFWPLFGADAALHGLLGLMGGYFGYALSSHVPEIKRGPSDYRTAVRNG